MMWLLLSRGSTQPQQRGVFGRHRALQPHSELHGWGEADWDVPPHGHSFWHARQAAALYSGKQVISLCISHSVCVWLLCVFLCSPVFVSLLCVFLCASVFVSLLSVFLCASVCLSLLCVFLCAPVFVLLLCVFLCPSVCHCVCLSLLCVCLCAPVFVSLQCVAHFGLWLDLFMVCLIWWKETIILSILFSQLPVLFVWNRVFRLYYFCTLFFTAFVVCLLFSQAIPGDTIQCPRVHREWLFRSVCLVSAVCHGPEWRYGSFFVQ